MFSCEFGEIFKNTFYYRTPLVAASLGKTKFSGMLDYNLNSMNHIEEILTPQKGINITLFSLKAHSQV